MIQKNHSSFLLKFLAFLETAHFFRMKVKVILSIDTAIQKYVFVEQLCTLYEGATLLQLLFLGKDSVRNCKKSAGCDAGRIAKTR